MTLFLSIDSRRRASRLYISAADILGRLEGARRAAEAARVPRKRRLRYIADADAFARRWPRQQSASPTTYATLDAEMIQAFRQRPVYFGFPAAGKAVRFLVMPPAAAAIIELALRLKPRIERRHIAADVRQLPRGRAAIELMAPWLGMLISCAGQYFLFLYYYRPRGRLMMHAFQHIIDFASSIR